MNRRILIAAVAVVGSTVALPQAASAADDPSMCDPYTEDCTPCEYDGSILASSPACDPCNYPDSSTIDPSCEETTTTTVAPPTTTEPPVSTEPPATEPPATEPPATEPTTIAPETEPEEPTTTAVDPDAGALPQAPTTTAVAANTPQLPETGGNGATMSVIALGFLAAGAALVAASRRPQQTN